MKEEGGGGELKRGGGEGNKGGGGRGGRELGTEGKRPGKTGRDATTAQSKLSRDLLDTYM